MLLLYLRDSDRAGWSLLPRQPPASLPNPLELHIWVWTVVSEQGLRNSRFSKDNSLPALGLNLEAIAITGYLQDSCSPIHLPRPRVSRSTYVGQTSDRACVDLRFHTIIVHLLSRALVATVPTPY